MKQQTWNHHGIGGEWGNWCDLSDLGARAANLCFRCRHFRGFVNRDNGAKAAKAMALQSCFTKLSNNFLHNPIKYSTFDNVELEATGKMKKTGLAAMQHNE